MTRRGYAADTTVSVDKSKFEIERLLRSVGANGFRTAWMTASADGPGWDEIEFLWKERVIRFRLARPSALGPNKKPEPWAMDGRQKWKRLEGARLDAAIEQRNRSRWRVLFLTIKAKIESVEAGVSVFEEEFLSHIVTEPNGPTIGEVLIPRLSEAGRLLLPAGA